MQGAQPLALDTSPFIYLVERHPTFYSKVAPIFGALDAGDARGVTSVLTLVETLVQPLQRGASTLVDAFQLTLLGSPHLQVLSVDAVIAELAARIRAQHAFRVPDALHLATAQHAGADAFITNDARLRAFAGVRVVCLDAL